MKTSVNTQILMNQVEQARLDFLLARARYFELRQRLESTLPTGQFDPYTQEENP